jgi:hypothetical protein
MWNSGCKLPSDAVGGRRELLAARGFKPFVTGRSEMRRLVRYTSFVVLAAFLYLGWIMAERFLANRRSVRAPAPPAAAYASHGSAVKILQFYASPGELVEGEKAILCYGVVNATAVRIDPPVDELAPSMNRCFEVAPERDTRYTLTAEGAGEPVTESFVIRVKPDPDRLPRITYFSDRRKQAVSNVVGTARAKFVHSLCFHTENAAQITVDPPAIPPSSAIEGCFYVAPEATTTYILTAADRKGRKAQKKVTVKVE